jgi:formylglycine-generating enzyme required for sulfatase activity
MHLLVWGAPRVYAADARGVDGSRGVHAVVIGGDGEGPRCADLSLLEVVAQSDETGDRLAQSRWNLPSMLEPTGFWSYTSSDDLHSGGKLSRLRLLLAAEMQQQVGRVPPVRIFQDIEAIRPGAEWETKIREALAASSFLIPIITPGFLQSEWCCREIAQFREMERERGRNDLVFPIHYVNVDHVDGGNSQACHDPAVLKYLKERQWTDFRALRNRNSGTVAFSLFIERLAGAICAALRTSSVTTVAGGFEHFAMSPASEVEGASGRDAFGPWREFSVPDAQGAAVTQRLRWIRPGRFLMGSPATEAERSDDEGPQHEVTITRGFWLAETACTQALWQAVMGDNPSRFKGDGRLPVERVSWRDVKRFLARIEGLHPGPGASLPSEAEWEYACRAGTTTPFSFGAEITPDQVNYDGKHPYAGREKGLFRQKTVPVGSLPPNPWGLYEMHGNVWEWCADGPRRYDGGPQVDPRGPEAGEQAERAVRGGGWFGSARRARSAFRLAFQPVDAYDSLGFRVCVRSSGSSPAEPANGAER